LVYPSLFIILHNMTNNKPTQVVDFSNPNADKITSGSTKTMTNNNKQTAIKQFVATFKTSIQISPDDWKVINPSMLCNQNTTLGEIEHFVNSNNNVGILEFKVIELINGGGEQ